MSIEDDYIATKYRANIAKAFAPVKERLAGYDIEAHERRRRDRLVARIEANLPGQGETIAKAIEAQRARENGAGERPSREAAKRMAIEIILQSEREGKTFLETLNALSNALDPEFLSPLERKALGFEPITRRSLRRWPVSLDEVSEIPPPRKYTKRK